MNDVKDHFSGHAAAYREARPTYPEALFLWLAEIAPDRHLAWDVGCGNGQPSVALARRFERVVATDPSANQIVGNTALHQGEWDDPVRLVEDDLRTAGGSSDTIPEVRWRFHLRVGTV